MSLDIAMGGSTNTVLHLLAVAGEAGTDFTMKDIDALSRKVPCICKVAPNTQKYHIQDVGRAGGVLGIMSELAKAGLVDTTAARVDGMTLGEAVARYDILSSDCTPEVCRLYASAPAGRRTTRMASQDFYHDSLDTDRENGCIRDIAHAYTKDGGLGVLFGNIARDGCVIKTAGVDESIWHFKGPAKVFDSQEAACGIVGIASAFQQARVTALETQREHVESHVGTRFVYDSYYSERHADLAQFQPVRQSAADERAVERRGE